MRSEVLSFLFQLPNNRNVSKSMHWQNIGISSEKPGVGWANIQSDSAKAVWVLLGPDAAGLGGSQFLELGY